jgi:predicted metal-dependent hydrolase
MNTRSEQTRTLRYGNTLIEYTLSFSARETLAIHVYPDLRVGVDAPLDSPLEQIEAKVRKRAAWILKQQRELTRYAFELPPREYVSGEAYRYLGRQYRLKVLPLGGLPERVRMDRGQIVVRVPDPGDRERVKTLLEAWYRKHAERVFAERLAEWLPRFAPHGLTSPPALVIRRMKSRWGSCTPEGKITLNLKLISAPRRCIDYILVHELCHLVHPNHSPAFYQLLTRLIPDWETRREQLNELEF